MSAAELEKRDRRERTRVEVADACKGRWMQLKQLHAELPHIPYGTLRWTVQWLVKQGFLWQREANEQTFASTPVHEYRCKFV
jgi:hypothetical protein